MKLHTFLSSFSLMASSTTSFQASSFAFLIASLASRLASIHSFFAGPGLIRILTPATDAAADFFNVADCRTAGFLAFQVANFQAYCSAARITHRTWVRFYISGHHQQFTGAKGRILIPAMRKFGILVKRCILASGTRLSISIDLVAAYSLLSILHRFHWFQQSAKHGFA